jgi:hypothetical protein
LELVRRRGAAPREAIRELLSQPPRQRLDAASLQAIDTLCRRRVRFVLAGAAAARYHGAPAHLRKLEIALEDHPTNLRLFTSAARDPAIHTRVVPAPISFLSLRGSAEPFSWLAPPQRRVLNAWIDAPTGFVASLDDLIDTADDGPAELLAAVREELDRTQPGSRIYRPRSC